MSSFKPPLWQVALALGLVYVVWGSTYLAIRVAVEGMPPFLMAGWRWLLGGLIMLAAGLVSRQPWPRPREIGWSALIGCFLLLGGNGLVVWAEKTITSGMAALLVASLPLWTLGLGVVTRSGSRPTLVGTSGILLGFVGVLLLVWPSLAGGAQASLLAQGLVLFGTCLWAIGSLLGRHVAVPASGIYNSAIQMLTAALGFMALGAAFGEQIHWATVPSRSLLACCYLVVFGSVVGFSAFTWLVRHVRPELASTYAYVNPVVAVLLGALILNERVDGWTLGGAALIVASVALVIQGGRPQARPAPAPAPAALES